MRLISEEVHENLGHVNPGSVSTFANIDTHSEHSSQPENHDITVSAQRGNRAKSKSHSTGKKGGGREGVGREIQRSKMSQGK